MRKYVYLLLLAFPTLSGIAQTGKEPVKVTDMLKIKSISGITLSSDGSKAAFTVTDIEPDPENKWEFKYINHLWVTATDGASAPKQLTYKEGSSQAAWSPDGRQLAFVRLADGKPQIFLLPLDGGEAIQLTKFKYGAGTPKWSPDGRQILFSTNVPLKDLLRDSLLNPALGVPQWPLEKPGFDKNQQLRSTGSKADPDGGIE